jgi:hypothetical protein
MISTDDVVRFIQKLKEMPGAISYDGDASIQVVFRLANGLVLRIGSTDDDVGSPLWADNYKGLFGELE